MSSSSSSSSSRGLSSDAAPAAAAAASSSSAAASSSSTRGVAFAISAQQPELVRGALCNLFSNLYKDKGLSGTREIHERMNASTKTQTRLAGLLRRPEIRLPELSIKLAEAFERTMAATKADKGRSLNKQEKDEINRQILDKFRQTYSWLTSVRMDTNEDGSIKAGANEDEHALPFGFMLVFGGAIASVPGSYEEQKALLKIFTDYLKAKRKNKATPVPTNIRVVLESIENAGRDISLLYRTDDVVLDILTGMGISDYQSFLQNSLTLNYYGLYLSESDSNQWKSNLVFVKLDDADDAPIRLKPWGALIEVFIDAVAEKLEEAGFSTESGAASSSTASSSAAKGIDWARLVSLAKEREGTRANTTVYPGGSATNKKVHLNVLENMRTVFDSHTVEKWKETARANMTYIIQFLCDHYNKDLPERTFFNCVLLKYNESFGDTRTKNRPPRAAAAAAADSARANAVHTSPPSKMRVDAPSATKGTDLKPVKLTRTAIDDYICAYSEQYRIDFTGNSRLQAILDSCKKPKLQRIVFSEDDGDAAGPPVSKKGRWSRGGRKTRRRKRRRKTKCKKKRNKKTKRKKRRKRKKKTKRKR